MQLGICGHGHKAGVPDGVEHVEVIDRVRARRWRRGRRVGARNVLAMCRQAARRDRQARRNCAPHARPARPPAGVAWLLPARSSQSARFILQSLRSFARPIGRAPIFEHAKAEFRHEASLCGQTTTITAIGGIAAGDCDAAGFLKSAIRKKELIRGLVVQNRRRHADRGHAHHVERDRRWIIPKGLPHKDKSPRRSAAREAFEEAGVVGAVGRRSIGSFSHDKRLKNGGVVTCKVLVFPLKVDRQDKEWPEKAERQVRWLSAERAAKRSSTRS